MKSAVRRVLPVLLVCCILGSTSAASAAGAQASATTTSSFRRHLRVAEGRASGWFERDYLETAAHSLPLLDSFLFDFDKDDHHLRIIQVQPDGQKITLAYKDDSGDDRYRYYISHQDTTMGVGLKQTITDTCRQGTCTKRLSWPGPKYQFVLIGFDFVYRLREKDWGGTQQDNHIDQIGVLEDKGTLTVYFNDRDDKDHFSWTVDYAYVPKDLVTTGSVTHSLVRGGNAAPLMKDDRVVYGESVICGFWFDFVQDDHHLDKISIETNNGFLQVDYRDKNGDDPYNWQVNWAVLKP